MDEMLSIFGESCFDDSIVRWWWLVEASWWRLKGFLGFRLQLCPPLPPWSHVTRVCVFQIHVRLRHTPPMTTLPYSGLSLLFDPLHSGAVHVDQTSLMPRCRMASAIPRINENSKSWNWSPLSSWQQWRLLSFSFILSVLVFIYSRYSSSRWSQRHCHTWALEETGKHPLSLESRSECWFIMNSPRGSR